MTPPDNLPAPGGQPGTPPPVQQQPASVPTGQPPPSDGNNANGDLKGDQNAVPVNKPEGGDIPTVNAGQIITDNFTLGGQITQIQQSIFTARSSQSRIFKFSQKAYCVQEDDQEQIAALFVADPAQIADLCERLKKKRVLVLNGEEGIGKRTLAIYLASIVAADDRNETPHQTYFVDPLERQVTVDVKKLCDDIPTCTFLVFRNACERDNADLRSFLSQLNRFSLAEYSEKLRKIDSYLVFTINTADADRVNLNIDDDVQYRLTNLSHDLLVQGLEKKLAHLSRDLETAGGHVEVMRKNQDTLISTLKTMPRLAEFVDYYLAAAARGEGPMDLEEALRRCDDVGYWFQRELSDFEQWCFTLSLGLAHRLGDSQDVSWFSFENLRRCVVAWLKDDPELFPKENEQSRTSAADQKERKLRLLDDDFLNFCRAEIAKDHDSLSDLIVFRSRSYSSRLWDVLLQHYRSILCVLLPHLSEAAENGDRLNQPFHRELCAQIIGRIGEIDPERITAPLMDRWMYSDVLSHQALVGALYQGILASNSERYRNSFLDRLNALSNLYSVDEDEEKSWNDHDVVAIVEEAAKTDDKKIEKKHMLALTAVYAQIGDKHFELAMKGLERIAEKQLVPLIENVQRVGRLLERSESWFQQRLTNKEARELRNFQTILSNVIERIYNQQRYTFAGVQCAFWLLSLNLDPITVFAELRRWIKKSSQTTGALVALMFLYEEGIARDLESHQVEVASSESGSSERHSCNAILASLKSDESVLEMARFLVTLYESFSIPFVFPSQMAQYLEESLMLRLKTWAEAALPIESCRHVTKKLFIELMRVHQGVLFDRVYRLLHDKKFGKKHPELKKEFVDAVLWQSC